MALKTARKEAPSAQRRKRFEATDEPRQWTREHLGLGAVFAAFTLLVIIVCFVGLSPAGPQVVKGQIAHVRITAEFPFSYTSEIETGRARAELGERIPPVYRLDQQNYERFRDHLLKLDERMTEYLSASDVQFEAAEGPQEGILKVAPDEMAALLRDLPGGNRYNLNGEDLAALANTLSRQRRGEVFNEALRVLADLYRQGVYDREHGEIRAATGSLSFFNIEDESGTIGEVGVLSEEQALSDLKINLSAIDVPRDAFVALFRIMRAGLQPNLTFDQARTDALVQEAMARVEPRVVRVRQGETIIEPNSRVSERQFEQLQAYREEMAQHESGMGFDSLLYERSFLAVAAVFAGLLVLQIQRRDLDSVTRVLVLAGLVVVFNLTLVRLLLTLGEGRLAQEAPGLVMVLPWFAPVALGPIVIAILLGTPAGAIAAGFVAVFCALMQDNSLAVLLVSLLAALAGVYACRGVQVRARVVRAGVISGGVMALCSIFMALRDNPESLVILLEQMGAAVITGFLTGTAVVGLLPILENLFRHTTDITLLELTDFNHPLLRKMQLAAPGSYHHSLMVANLAENAAATIGANPLVCRVAALYHDIGKLIKPEYFIENQREVNPHLERNPSMSALIIKAHVKEGVILARQYRLPRVIIDVIRQHHGTTLIQYFYYMALQRQQDINATTTAPPGACKVELDEVSENTYRYEGPKPQFIESAIVMLADSMEAASRSLKKVTPQSIEDFVQRIVQGRIDDGQLDEVPITLEQIALVRESFRFTLLNMLHSRIEYPKAEKEKPRRNTPAPFPVAPDGGAKAPAGGDAAAGAEAPAPAPQRPAELPEASAAGQEPAPPQQAPQGEQKAPAGPAREPKKDSKAEEDAVAAAVRRHLKKKHA